MSIYGFRERTELNSIKTGKHFTKLSNYFFFLQLWYLTAQIPLHSLKYHHYSDEYLAIYIFDYFTETPPHMHTFKHYRKHQLIDLVLHPVPQPTDPSYYYGNNDGQITAATTTPTPTPMISSISTIPNSSTLLVGGNSNDSIELMNGLHTQPITSHEIRSPMAATRANSLASASSPTSSATTGEFWCTSNLYKSI